MDSKEAWVLSKIIFVLIVVLSIFSVFNLTTHRTDQQSRLNPTGKRSPASLIKISELQSNSLISKAKVSTLDLNCLNLEKPLRLKSQSNQLRLVGKVCQPQEKDQPKPKILITNTRNGYQATVFELNNEKFSTDYVFLEKGRNSIVISQVGEDQMTLTTIANLEIERLDKFVIDSENLSNQ